jgi:hypothetical protein
LKKRLAALALANILLANILLAILAPPSAVRAENPQPHCPKTCEAHGQWLSSSGVPPGV